LDHDRDRVVVLMITFFLLVLVGVVSTVAMIGSLVEIAMADHRMTKQGAALALAVFVVSVPTFITVICYGDSIATTNASVVERATECARSIP
jgi:SNF family Na+-dependent transporter